MTPFEIVTAILNLLALILIPIIAVIIGQHLQNVSDDDDEQNRLVR